MSTKSTRGKTAAPVRLSELSHGAGCGCKIHASVLEQVLHHLPTVKDPKVLVGHGKRDDAAVYQLSATQAVVQTADFFTPMVDDPFVFGQIAAANAISDIYAMGAKPLFALNLVGFPAKTLPLDMLHEILRGGAEKAKEAGIPVLGGHSIDDPEPKYGMSVTGLVHPRRVLTNAGAQPGDMLILTKPLGVGVITTGIKKGKAPPDAVKSAVASMSQLNRAAGEVFAKHWKRVHALTDVTGFGLLGHLWNMVEASRVRADVYLDWVPFIPGARALCEQGIVPGGTRANLAWVKPHVQFKAGDEVDHLLLADAQTNGGLLAAVPGGPESSKLFRDLDKAGVVAQRVGLIQRIGKPAIRVKTLP
jgi:selenide,water dikinase